MVIAFQITNTTSDFNYNCFLKLALKHPTHQFLMLHQKQQIIKKDIPENIKPVKLKYAHNTGVYHAVLNQIQLRAYLKKFKVDYYFSSNEASIAIKNITKIAFLHHTKAIKQKQKFKKTNNADFLIATNEYVFEKTIKTIPEYKNKAKMIPYGVEKMEPISVDDSIKIKQQHTAEKDFFLAVQNGCSTAQLLVILKSFSAFKKWQQSNFKLIIYIDEKQVKSSKKLLGNYKYRSDVLLINKTEDFVTMFGAAYAVVFGGSETNFIEMYQLAFKYKIPMLLPEDEHYKAIAKNAAVYGDLSEKTIAEKLILLYKDESLRNTIIDNMSKESAQLQWEDISEKLWNWIINKKA
jgi:glycosyltransferase involved in cell wall biosynthesis